MFAEKHRYYSTLMSPPALWHSGTALLLCACGSVRPLLSMRRRLWPCAAPACSLSSAGYNSACRIAAIPSAFTWSHPETGTAVLALANNNYGSSIIVPPNALVFKYQMDNSSE